LHDAFQIKTKTVVPVYKPLIEYICYQFDYKSILMYMYFTT